MSHWSEVPPNIVWCESTNGWGHAFSPYVAEFLNTLSNSFYFIAALVGLWRIYHTPALKDIEFVVTEILLLFVGTGSILFHAFPCRLTEIMDELPMSILACGYLACCRTFLPSVISSKMVRWCLFSEELQRHDCLPCFLIFRFRNGCFLSLSCSFPLDGVLIFTPTISKYSLHCLRCVLISSM
jgi:hypothetical protein